MRVQQLSAEINQLQHEFHRELDPIDWPDLDPAIEQINAAIQQLRQER